MDAELENASDAVALIALQGPKSSEILEAVLGRPVTLQYYHFTRVDAGRFFGSRLAIISRTGYTGELGYEIYCDADRAADVWKALMDAGAPHGLKPAGLGARDTLRLEAGFCLYGNDLDDETNPLEAGLGWLTKLDKGDFNGRDALLEVKEHKPARKLVGFVMQERGIPRQGYALLAPDGTPVGTVTSGTQSPILGRGIGLGYVPNDPSFTKPGAPLAVEVRGRALGATVTKPPFHKE
jgi:aminomethyltransferase